MKQVRIFALAILASSLFVGAASAGGGDGLGPYVRGGIALGWANVDDDFVGAAISNGTNAGFSFGGGYRFSPLLAAEAEFSFVTGGDVTANGVKVGNAETQAIAFTFDAKIYPLSLISGDATGFLQPYARFGMGGGNGKLKNAAQFTGDEGTFLVRFGAGLDLMFTEKLGAYADGSYYITTKDIIGGNGSISFGGIFKF